MGEGGEGSGMRTGDGMDSGRQSHLSQRSGSRMSGSRPGSQFGRQSPGSKKRLGQLRGGQDVNLILICAKNTVMHLMLLHNKVVLS